MIKDEFKGSYRDISMKYGISETRLEILLSTNKENRNVFKLHLLYITHLLYISNYIKNYTL